MKKSRAMTPKWFLHRSNSKAANNASAFIAEHRSFLESGIFADKCSAILRQLDARELMPSVALGLVRNIVFSHIIQIEAEAAEIQIQKGINHENNGKASSKPWVARILDCRDNLCTAVNEHGEEIELEKVFDKASDADRWVDRRLFDGASDWYGVIEHTKIVVKNDPLTKIVVRADAIARILQGKKGPVSWHRGKSTSKLGFGMKVKGDRFIFSRG